MKKTVLFLCLLAGPIVILGQNDDPRSSPHNGFQFALGIGGGFGNTDGSTGTYGDIVYRGGRTIMHINLGYAVNNWAAGFTLGMNSQNITSLEVKNAAYKVTKGWTLDGGLTGMYIRRYFMPLNVYAGASLGTAKFSFFDPDAKLQGNTENGFSWSLMAGKEFSLGKKKNGHWAVT